MKYKKYLPPIFCFLLFTIVVIFYSFIQNAVDELNTNDNDSLKTNNYLEMYTLPTEEIDKMGLCEDKSIYDNDDIDSLVYFYVTVRYGEEAKGTNHTFSEVNNVIRFVNSEHVENDIYAEALIQIGDANGPQYGMLGYGQTKSNGKISIRGNSTSTAYQKSYNLKLDDDAGTWRGQSNIALNKHIYDCTRFRNKLYFDILKDVNDISSLRTQFVRLFIKDETSNQTKFKDYGLFTQVEVPSKKYLKNHGLDGNGYLYKAVDFNFENNGNLKSTNNPDFDLEEFEYYIKIKGNEDNQRLLDLIEEIEKAMDGKELLDTYFDQDNYLTWMSYNILMGNTDVTMHNFYLYSPLNGSKWYFIPWDGDGILGTKEESIKKEWEYGIKNYWGITLHRKILMDDNVRYALCTKIDELYHLITQEKINDLIHLYRNTIDTYVEKNPDYMFLNRTLEQREEIITNMSGKIEDNYYAFYDSLEEIMPFFFYNAKRINNQTTFEWEAAFDFKNKDLFYRLEISKYPDMRNAKVFDNIRMTSHTIDNLQSGVYYVRIRAYDEFGRSSGMLNYQLIDDVLYDGVERVVIE